MFYGIYCIFSFLSLFQSEMLELRSRLRDRKSDLDGRKKALEEYCEKCRQDNCYGTFS